MSMCLDMGPYYCDRKYNENNRIDKQKAEYFCFMMRILLILVIIE